MKAKLLKMARKRVSIINWWRHIANPCDKLVSVKRTDTKGRELMPVNNKGKVVYMTYNKAKQLYFEEVINSAKELKNKSCIWHVFH